MTYTIPPDLIADLNVALLPPLEDEYEALRRKLARRGFDIDVLTDAAMRFAVAVPSWGVGTGGTRFARFPGPGEPRGISEKLADCATIQQLCRLTPTVSPHFPWDMVPDMAGLRQEADALGLHFDAVNSNTFQDQPGQRLSYRYGSLSHTDKAVRDEAIAHNIACIRAGEVLGSQALTVWIADGSNFAGQAHLGRAFDRYVASMHEVVAALPADWQVFLEHKLYEPAFYSTVIADWGSSLLAAQELGPKARCLVDLGHHAPSVNIEQIVARLARAGKLAGFHFNDSRYGDDDLDAGSIDPFRLFLVFNELVEAGDSISPAYMIDQSHNVTDPVESLMTSAIEIARACIQSLLVDRAMLAEAQEHNDALMAHQALKLAFRTDVSPILARARERAGGAIDPVATFRASGYRLRKAEERPAVAGSRSGIV